MDSLKTVMVVGILAAIAYGVYVAINNNPQLTPPPGAAEEWASIPPDVQLGAGSQAPATPFGSADRAVIPGGPPDLSIPSEMAQGGAAAPRSTMPPIGAEPPPFEDSNAARLPNQKERPYSAVATDSGSPAAGEFPGGPADSANPAGMGEVTGGGGAARLDSRIGSPTPGEVGSQFTEFIEQVRTELDRGRFAEMLGELSAWYNEPRLSAEQHRQLTTLLDQVAGTVIYSRQHLLEPPYRVQANDSLAQIAEEYGVSAELLAKINGIQDPASLRPGDELKVVRGPFNAVIDLEKLELTMQLQGRYAGRFPIGIGRDRTRLEGSYFVREKSLNPTYYGRDEVIGADDPANPLGQRWIGLGEQIGLHGTNDPRNVGSITRHGSICLGDADIDDVYDILSIGSRVVIRR